MRRRNLFQDRRGEGYIDTALIFVQQKDKVSTEASLFSEIETWLKEVPSVYVLKEWENVVFSTKTSMFRELFAYSPNWAKIVWDIQTAF